jgi:flagellar protein FliS
MKLTETQRSYQMSAIQGASSIGLMIVLFDRLAVDLRRAAAALRENDIETRCRDLDHASMVIGQLQSWLDPEKGGESAQTLTRFYACLRAKMMEAAVSSSAEILETQIDMIMDVRSAWQNLDIAPLEAAEMTAGAPAHQNSAPSELVSETKVERIPFSQSG